MKQVTPAIALFLLTGVCCAQTPRTDLDQAIGLELSVSGIESVDCVSAPDALPHRIIRRSDVDQESIRCVQILASPGVQMVPILVPVHLEKSVFRISWTYSPEGRARAGGFREEFIGKKVCTSIGAFQLEHILADVPSLPLPFRSKDLGDRGESEADVILLLRTLADAERILAGLTGD